MARPSNLPIGWKARMIGAIGFSIIRIVGLTLRFELHAKSPIVPQDQDELHLDTLAQLPFQLPIDVQKVLLARRGAALTSASKDGEIAFGRARFGRCRPHFAVRVPAGAPKH